MTTALFILFGISGCATLLVVTTVALAARRGVPALDQAVAPQGSSAPAASAPAAQPTFRPSYSH